LICYQGSSCREFVRIIVMHEIRIAEDLSEIVTEVARREKLTNVSKINICFGQLIQIVPEVFEIAFREAVKDSTAENATLSIEILSVKMKCRNCNNDFQVSENRFACSICNSTDLEIIQGKELFIKSIEGD
jgi:hydrogenase nickel incorporation protein HypA/HybF